MKRFPLYFVTAAALLASASVAVAQTAAPAAPAAAPAAGIAFVNAQQIMNDAAASKGVREQLDAKFKAFQADVSKKGEQLQKEAQDLGKQRSVLSKDAFEEKARAYRNKEADAQKEAQAKKAVLDNASGKAIGSIQKAIVDIVTDIAKERNYSSVMLSNAAVYADPKMDISAEVLDRLNKKLPKVDVKFDSASDAAPAAKDKK